MSLHSSLNQTHINYIRERFINIIKYPISVNTSSVIESALSSSFMIMGNNNALSDSRSFILLHTRSLMIHSVYILTGNSFL